jgi:hypothetical protein
MADDSLITGQIAPTPGTAPGTGGSTGGGGIDIQGMVGKLLQQQQQAGSGRPLSHISPPQPPSSRPGAGVMSAGIAASMFMPFVGAGVLYAAKKKKEEQVKQAVGDFHLLDALFEKAQLAAGQPDQQGYDDKVKQIYGDLIAQSMDPKRIKNLHKTLFQDPLNAKDTVHSDAAKQFSQIKGGEDKLKQLSAALAQSMMNRSTAPQQDPKQQIELLGIAERDKSTTALTQHRGVTEQQGQEKIDETKTKDKNLQSYREWLMKHGDAGFDEKKSEFKQTLEFKKWKEKLDTDTKMRISSMNQQKPSQTLQPVAIFSRTGLNQLSDAEWALNKLEQKGVLGNVLGNKVDDIIFGRGFTDPRLDQETRQLIGKVRAAMAYTSSAAMRAHTGRTSREIYDDFKNTLRIGQDIDALRGAIEQTRSMMTEYANVLVPEVQESLRRPVGSKDGKPRLPGDGPSASASKGKSVVTDPNKIPD